MALRAHPRFEVIKNLPEIGWRAMKQYYQVRDAEEVTKCEKVLAWMSPGPDAIQDQRSLISLQKSLSQLQVRKKNSLCLFLNFENVYVLFQHPSIMPSDLILLQPHGCLTVRKLLTSGSLKDYLNDSKPKLNYLKKTIKPKNLKPFDLNAIRTLGHQVLSALKFLHEKNLVHGNLHSGNVYMLDGSLCISEIENYLMGASSILRPFIVQLKGPSSSAEAVDVYSFGHLVYEMATGVPLHNQTCDNAIPNTVPEMLRTLIESLLSIEATKSSNYPTVQNLLENPFFSNAIGSLSVTKKSVMRPYLKFSTAAKEALASHKMAYENRLREDFNRHKLVEKEKKRQEVLTDDSRRKRRQLKDQVF